MLYHSENVAVVRTKALVVPRHSSEGSMQAADPNEYDTTGHRAGEHHKNELGTKDQSGYRDGQISQSSSSGTT